MIRPGHRGLTHTAAPLDERQHQHLAIATHSTALRTSSPGELGDLPSEARHPREPANTPRNLVLLHRRRLALGTGLPLHPHTAHAQDSPAVFNGHESRPRRRLLRALQVLRAKASAGSIGSGAPVCVMDSRPRLLSRHRPASRATRNHRRDRRRRQHDGTRTADRTAISCACYVRRGAYPSAFPPPRWMIEIGTFLMLLRKRTRPQDAAASSPHFCSGTASSSHSPPGPQPHRISAARMRATT